MKTILLLFGLATLLFASINESLVCKKCHPIIYKEYFNSSLAKASIINNPINNTVCHNIKDAQRFRVLKKELFNF